VGADTVPGTPVEGVFGRVHRSGWKGIGALYAEGRLRETSTAMKPELPAWYAPGAYRSLGQTRAVRHPAALLFSGGRPVDRREIGSLSPRSAGYAEIGRVELLNGKGVTIYEISPSDSEIGRVDALDLIRPFDEQATPARFTEGPQPSQKVNANFGSLIRLAGFDAWQAGESVAVTLFWEALQEPSVDYSIFVHIEGGLDGSGPAGVWGQLDGWPACRASPTRSWSPGSRIVDRRIISPKEAPAGSYTLIAGLYRPDTGERLPVLDETGTRSPTAPCSRLCVATPLTLLFSAGAQGRRVCQGTLCRVWRFEAPMVRTAA
jgi:hypothetical protein